MTALNRTYEEKRDFIRMKVDTPATLQITSEEQTEYIIQGMCYEISGGGILLGLDQELAIGTKATVMINSKAGHHPILNAEIEIKRVAYHSHSNAAKPTDTFCLGAEITKVLS